MQFHILEEVNAQTRSCCHITAEYTNPPVLSPHLKWSKFLSIQICWKNQPVKYSETWGRCILGI